ncbi:MAG: type II secretion system protein GspG [Spirochaetota bacterium]
MKIKKNFITIGVNLTACMFLIITLIIISCNGKESPEGSVNVLITRDGLKTMQVALELYKEEHGEYPDLLEEIIIKKGITDRSVIKDAWGREYQYHKLGTGYVIFSKGYDGKPYTEDDIYPP